ncbi:hypothetical protein ACFL35_20665 [Candidatus Riflebacteria bacterium]
MNKGILKVLLLCLFFTVLPCNTGARQKSVFLNLQYAFAVNKGKYLMTELMVKANPYFMREMRRSDIKVDKTDAPIIGYLVLGQRFFVLGNLKIKFLNDNPPYFRYLHTFNADILDVKTANLRQLSKQPANSVEDSKVVVAIKNSNKIGQVTMSIRQLQDFSKSKRENYFNVLEGNISVNGVAYRINHFLGRSRVK